MNRHQLIQLLDGLGIRRHKGELNVRTGNAYHGLLKDSATPLRLDDMPAGQARLVDRSAAHLESALIRSGAPPGHAWPALAALGIWLSDQPPQAVSVMAKISARRAR